VHHTRRLVLVLVLQHALILTVALLAIAGAGTLLAGARDSVALRMTIGLSAWAQALFLLAAIGQLRAGAIVALLLVSLAGFVRAPRLALPHPLFAALVPLFAFVPLFALALRPPVAFDETLYHLPYVRALAESGALRFLPELRFPVFPQLHELLCVPLFLAGGDVATHLVSLVEVMLTAALLVEWGRRYEPRAGMLAAAFFLGSPIVIQLATVAHVDAALTLFVTAGLYCLDRGRPLLTGLFLGTACGVKYLGGFFAAAAARKRTVLPIALFALPVTLWLVLATGNPVFPFFGSNAWNLPLPEVPLGTRIVRTLLLPWNVTFARGEVNQQPPFTPLFAVALVVVLVAAFRDVRARFVAIVVVLYVAAFAFLPQDSRYLVPLLPLVGMVFAVTIARRWPKIAVPLAIVAILPGLGYTAYRLWPEGIPADRRAFLAREIPEYEALQRADDTVYVCGAEQLKYHAPRRLLGDHAGPYAFARVLRGDVAANLRAIDARYLLVSKRICTTPVGAGLELVYEDEHAQLWRVQSSPSRR